jgi:hypothetical protein
MSGKYYQTYVVQRFKYKSTSVSMLAMARHGGIHIHIPSHLLPKIQRIATVDCIPEEIIAAEAIKRGISALHSLIHNP